VEGDVMLPNVYSKPMAEVLGPPVFFVRRKVEEERN